MEKIIFLTYLFSVFVVCAYGLDIIHLLCAGLTHEMMNGEFVFITVDFSRAIELDLAECDVSVATEGKMVWVHISEK